jgi:hypothetical protein
MLLAQDAVPVNQYTDAVYKDAGGTYVGKWTGGGVEVKAIGFKGELWIGFKAR